MSTPATYFERSISIGSRLTCRSVGGICTRGCQWLLRRSRVWIGEVRQTRIDELAAEGKSVVQVVQDELHHLDNYIAATQLGITLASLALGWIGEPSGYALPPAG